MLQWISTHFGRAGMEISWELGNYVPEFAVSLLLLTIKLRTLKQKSRNKDLEVRFKICELQRELKSAVKGLLSDLESKYVYEEKVMTCSWHSLRMYSTTQK